MSKQVNRVNIERVETGLPTGSMMKYNCFVNLSTSCKTDIILSHSNAGHTYTMQELVKVKK